MSVLTPWHPAINFLENLENIKPIAAWGPVGFIYRYCWIERRGEMDNRVKYHAKNVAWVYLLVGVLTIGLIPGMALAKAPLDPTTVPKYFFIARVT